MSDSPPPADEFERRHVAIVGAMGVGKSTLGKELAAALGRPHRDSDRDIEALFGRSGADIAAEHGIERLHELERAVLIGALAVEEPTVISAAASVVDSDLVRQALRRRSLIVHLVAPIETTLERQAAAIHRRPMDRVELKALLERRRPGLAEITDLELDATEPPATLVEMVRDRLTGRNAG